MNHKCSNVRYETNYEFEKIGRAFGECKSLQLILMLAILIFQRQRKSKQTQIITSNWTTIHLWLYMYPKTICQFVVFFLHWQQNSILFEETKWELLKPGRKTRTNTNTLLRIWFIRFFNLSTCFNYIIIAYRYVWFSLFIYHL